MTVNITTGDGDFFSTSRKSPHKKFKKNGDFLRYVINFLKLTAKEKGTAKRPSGLNGSTFVIFHKTETGIEKIDFTLDIKEKELEMIIKRVWDGKSI